MALDSGGNVYLAGSTGLGIAGFALDMMVIKYGPDGDEQWVTFYDAPTGNGAIGLVVSESGAVTVAGNAGVRYPNNLFGSHIVLLRYAQSPVSSVTDDSTPLPERFQLLQNYPNPFNPVTHLRFRISDFAFAELTIYDVMGRKVKTVVRGRLSPGSHEVQWDGTDDAGQPVASGVYVYRLRTANGFTASRKMVLLK